MLKFSDIDECISNSCDTNANCENVIGSYNCKCKGGFTGDGTSCKGNYIIMYNTVKYNCWFVQCILLLGNFSCRCYIYCR